MTAMKRVKSICITLLAAVLMLTLCGCSVQKTSSNEEDDPMKELKWWQKTIVYEVYPNSFKDTHGDGYGDIQGLISELDHLQSLGVGAVWMTPVLSSPMGDNGYDVSDYYSINPHFGTMDDMDQLIEEAGKRNIRIVMDLVFNHTSNECSWFLESKQSKDNPKSDWYIWRDAKEDGSAPNNWRGIFGGSAWTWCEERGQYYLHTFADFQPDLNWENPEVRKELFRVANFWVDKGVGGFRVDAITYIKKPADFADGIPDDVDGMAGIHKMTANSDGILDFLHEFKHEVEDGTDIFMVGEANGVPSEQLPQWVGSDGVFDMIFGFDLMNLPFSDGEIWYKTKDFTVKDFKSIISKDQAITAENGWCPVFLENHDQPRSVEHFLPGCTDYVKGAKLLGMMLMTLRGTPFIYEGEEIGMTNVNRDSIIEYDDISSHNQFKMAIQNGLSEDEALKCVQRFSRDNARSPMQWDNSENAGFTSGRPWIAVNDNYKTVNVDVESKDEESILRWYQRLNRLRNDNPVLITGNYKEILTESNDIFAYTRSDGNDCVTVLLNFTGQEVSYDLSLVKGAELLLSSEADSQTGQLKPYEAVCYRIIK